MGGKSGSKKGQHERERISLDSDDKLHGHVDFFGIETKRANKYTHQKLKVIQTWLFIQGLVMVLLLGYLVLLTVWLWPFFPMVFEADTHDGVLRRSSVFQAAVADVRKAEDDLVDLDDDVKDLEQWRAEHENETIRINETLIKHQGYIEDLYNTTENLDERVDRLEHALFVAGIKTIKDLRDDIDSFNNEIAEVKGCCSTNGEQIHDLQCFKEAIEPTVEQLENFTQKNLDKLANGLNQLSDTVQTVRQDANQCQEKCDAAATNFENELNQAVKTLEEENTITFTRLCDLEQNITDWREDTDTTFDILKSNATCLADRAAELAQKQRDHLSFIKQKLIEERGLSANAVDVISRALQSKTANLERKIEEVYSNLNDSIDNAKQEGNEATIALQTQFTEMQSTLNDTQADLQGQIQQETVNLTNQDSDLSDRIEAVSRRVGNIEDSHIIEKFGNLQNEFVVFKPNTIKSLQNVKGQLCDLKDAIDATNKTYEAQISALDNKTSALDERQRDLDFDYQIMQQRVSNAEDQQIILEATYRENKNDFDAKILEASESAAQNQQELDSRMSEAETRVLNCCVSGSASVIESAPSDSYYDDNEDDR